MVAKKSPHDDRRVSPPADLPLAKHTQRGHKMWQALPNNTRGAAWMILAGLGFTTMALVVKLLGQRLDSFQIGFFRCLFGFVVLAPIIWRTGLRSTFRTDQPQLHLARSLVGVTAMLCFFWALARAPLADVTAISFAKPLFVIVLAVLFLGETVRWRRWCATVVGFGGVILMLRPGTAGFDPNLLPALVGAAGVATAVILVKKLSAQEKTLTMLAWFGIVSSAIALVPAIIMWQAPTPMEWGLLLLVGTLGVSSQSCIIRAYRVGEATAVAPFDYTRLIFAVAFGFLLFGDIPDGITMLGAAIIVASTLYIAQREARLGTKPSEPGASLQRKL